MRLKVVGDPISYEFRVAQTVGMMRGAFLDHDRDAAPEAMVGVFDGKRVFFEQEVETAADMQEWDVVLRKFTELGERIGADGWIVGVDAGGFIGIGGGPIVLVDAAFP